MDLRYEWKSVRHKLYSLQNSNGRYHLVKGYLLDSSLTIYIITL